MFDFNEENFFLHFAQGRMTYHLAAFTLGDTLWIYGYEHRGIIEQQLNLKPAQRAALDAFLQWNVQPEHAAYRYDYFLANCSTKLRDAIDRVLGGALHQQLQATPTPATFRSEAVRLVSPDLAFALGMDFGLGPNADRPINAWERSYVPDALMQAIRSVRVDGQPLVLAERRLLESQVPDAPAKLPDWSMPMLVIGIAIALAILALSFARGALAGRATFAIVTTTTVLLFGFAGLVSLCIWTLTEHWSGARCPNLLQFSPLLLLLVPGWFRSRRADWMPSRLHRALMPLLLLLSVGGLVLSFLTVTAASRHWIGLSLPVLIALTFATFRAGRAA